MEILSEQHQETLVISLAGSLDALTADQAQSAIGEQLDVGQEQVVLDLSRVDFMSSAGIRVLLEMLKRSRSLGGDIRLAAAQPDVQRILDISGLVHVIKVYPSMKEARDSFGPKGPNGAD